MKKKMIAGLIVLTSVGGTFAGCGLGSSGTISQAKEEIASAVSEEASKDLEMLKNDIDAINQLSKETESSKADVQADGKLVIELDDGKIKFFEFPVGCEPEVLNVKEEILGQNGKLIDLNNEPIENNASVGQKNIYKLDESNHSITLYNGNSKEFEDLEINNKLEKCLGYTYVEGESIIWFLAKEADIENTKITLKGYDTGFNEKYSFDLRTLFSGTDEEINPDQIVRYCEVRGNDYNREDTSVVYISIYGEKIFYPIDLKQNKLLSYKGYFSDNGRFFIDESVGYDLQNDIYGDVDKGIIYKADGSVKADLSEYDFQSFNYIPYCDLYELYNAENDGHIFVTGDGKKTDISLFGPQAKTISLVKGYNKNKIFMIEYENNDGDKLFGFSNFDGETIIEPELGESAPETYIVGDYLSYGSNVYNVSTKKKTNDTTSFSLLGEARNELCFESDKHIFLVVSSIMDSNWDSKPAALIVIEKGRV